jgi:hypothetical protein
MITDGRILNALCRRLTQQINAKGVIYYERRYKYVDFTHVDDIAPAVFDKVRYKGNDYKLHFYSGCFSPYFIRLKL